MPATQHLLWVFVAVVCSVERGTVDRWRSTSSCTRRDTTDFFFPPPNILKQGDGHREEEGHTSTPRLLKWHVPVCPMAGARQHERTSSLGCLRPGSPEHHTAWPPPKSRAGGRFAGGHAGPVRLPALSIFRGLLLWPWCGG